MLEVLDGDTFVIEKAQRVRLLGVDAPDLKYCGGEEAKEELEKMIGKNRVYLEEIVTDKFARIVAVVYVGNTPLNTEMAKKGWVENNSTQSSERENIKEAQKEAKESRLGVYSEECSPVENKEKPECDIKGNNSVSGEKRYYPKGCSNYKQTVIQRFLGDEWFCTEKEAQKAGYVKGKSCY